MDDFKTLTLLLEKAEIDFEEYTEPNGKTILEIKNDIYVIFNKNNELESIDKGEV